MCKANGLPSLFHCTSRAGPTSQIHGGPPVCLNGDSLCFRSGRVMGSWLEMVLH